jgi:uncharacterized protein
MSATQTKNFALVTGASQGLGREMAKELARQKRNVLLVALPGEGLPEFCKELKNGFGIEAYYFETDLTQSNSVFELASWALSNYKIDVLINNAGIGGSLSFDTASIPYIENIILLNVRALSLLTRLILPELKKHPKAWILNVASMASFSPIAYKTVYPASKAFVYSFSRGLYEELKDTGVFVSVLHPGPIATNPEVSERIKANGFFGKLGLLTPAKLAKIAITQLFKRDSLILPGFMNKLNWLLIKTVPIWIRLPLVSAVVKRNEIVPQKINLN